MDGQLITVQNYKNNKKRINLLTLSKLELVTKL